jgi:hypothetical protein
VVITGPEPSGNAVYPGALQAGGHPRQFLHPFFESGTILPKIHGQPSRPEDKAFVFHQGFQLRQLSFGECSQVSTIGPNGFKPMSGGQINGLKLAGRNANVATHQVEGHFALLRFAAGGAKEAAREKLGH